MQSSKDLTPIHKGEGYSEWTIVGEPVHIAKRLHGLEELKFPNPVCGAFGIAQDVKSHENLLIKMNKILGIIAGVASKFTHNKTNIEELKGVGNIVWAHLVPKESNN